jgi:hypothetical protein
MHTEAQREHGGKRLGWRHRDGNQPVAGPHPDPDTTYETLHGSLDVYHIYEKQETRIRIPYYLSGSGSGSFTIKGKKLDLQIL